MRRQARPAADEIGMRRKGLFYLSCRLFVVGLRGTLPEGNAYESPYPGLSRCTTFTRYPAFRKSLPTSSAIITERCCPPVHPKEIVR